MAARLNRPVDEIESDLKDMFIKGLGCGQCATGCPEKAITMIEIREPGFIPE